MGIFLKATFDSQGGHTPAGAAKNQAALTDLVNGLGDYAWQDAHASLVNGLDRSVSHISLSVMLRLYRPENIEAGGLRSLMRYQKAHDRLVIDQVLSTDRYEHLPADETRALLCADVLAEISAGCLKYATRFSGFDVSAALPLIAQRIDAIASGDIRRVDSDEG